MKLIMILGLAGFLLGLTGATGIVVVREGEARDLAQVIADSTTAGTDSITPALQDSTQAMPMPNPAELKVADADTAAADSISEVPTEEPSAARERLAKLFGAMPARDAAKVMNEMGDQEVRILLGLLRDRQASAILSSLPPERAAAITSMVFSADRSKP